MKLIKVGAAVLNQTPKAWKQNKANILEAVRQAQAQKVSILCLPELCISGYGLEDDFFCADVADRSMRILAEIAPRCTDIVVCVGLPVRFNNSLYNAVATIVDGHLVGFTCKQHLAGDGIHYEPRHFKPWPAGVVQTIYAEPFRDPQFKPQFPIGDIFFSMNGVRIGYEICEDAWVANRPGTILATKGIDVYLNPSASHFSFGKLNTRKNFVVDGSRAFSATYIYTNLVGNESGRAIYDGGALIASGGTLLAQGKRFTYNNVLLTTAIVDVHNTKTSQVRTASFQPDVEHYDRGCQHCYFKFPAVTERNNIVQPLEASWENGIDTKHEECTRALGLALMDYMRKSKTKGFVISLSGGADSALVTYAVVQGIRLGVRELGARQFVEKFCPTMAHCIADSAFDYAEDMTIEALIKNLVATAYQPTENSGPITREAAEKLAAALGVPHMVLDVDPVFKAYLEIGKQIKGSDLNFGEDDLTIQNLQARVRSPSIWMIANMQSKLLLTTSNMSEAAVGYATMDGDTSGCISPIAGLPKVYIREYLRWVEIFGPEGIGSLPAMSYINKQAPTAELRPQECKQTDEEDLMPYWLLHMIQGYAVKNRYSPVEIYTAIKREVDYPNNRLIADIVKFFVLFSRNQWKRERYALSFHLDDHNLDPRSWCRTPILSGGYEEELTELKEYLV